MQGLGKDVLSLILQRLPFNAVCCLARTSKSINKQIVDSKYFVTLAMKIAAITRIPRDFCERCQTMHGFPNSPLKCDYCKSRSCVPNCCKIQCLGCTNLTSPNYDRSCNNCDSEMCKSCELTCT